MISICHNNPDFVEPEFSNNYEVERGVEVIATRGLPLLGNRLLKVCSINIDMRDGGAVTIEL